MKCAVINIDAGLGEVRCVEVGLAINESAGQARVARSVGSLDYRHRLHRGRCCPLSYSHVWIPSGNRPVNRGEQESGWSAMGQQKIRLTAVEDGACWRVLVIWVRLGNAND